jgi:hypothetical protein
MLPSFKEGSLSTIDWSENPGAGHQQFGERLDWSWAHAALDGRFNKGRKGEERGFLDLNRRGSHRSRLLRNRCIRAVGIDQQ